MCVCRWCVLGVGEPAGEKRETQREAREKHRNEEWQTEAGNQLPFWVQAVRRKFNVISFWISPSPFYVWVQESVKTWRFHCCPPEVDQQAAFWVVRARCSTVVLMAFEDSGMHARKYPDCQGWTCSNRPHWLAWPGSWTYETLVLGSPRTERNSGKCSSSSSVHTNHLGLC